MAHEDVGVPDFPEGSKLLRDFVDRSRDQGFCRNARIALAPRVLQHRLCVGRRLADTNVAPQRNGARLLAVSGAALAIKIGLRSGLLAGEAGARDPPLRQSCRAVDRRRCAGADPDLDGLGRTQRKARFGNPERWEAFTVSPASRRRMTSRVSSNAEGVKPGAVCRRGSLDHPARSLAWIFHARVIARERNPNFHPVILVADSSFDQTRARRLSQG
jgi:hypothetical protein